MLEARSLIIELRMSKPDGLRRNAKIGSRRAQYNGSGRAQALRYVTCIKAPGGLRRTANNGTHLCQ